MTTATKQRPAPKSLAECPKFAAASAKLDELQAQAVALRGEIQRLEEHGGQRFNPIVERARQLLYGADATSEARAKAREAADKRLIEARDELAVIEAAVQMQREDVARERIPAVDLVKQSWLAEYGRLVPPLVAAVVAAGKATRQLVDCRQAASAEGVEIGELECPALLSLAGEFPHRERLDHASVWLRHMADQGYVSQDQLNQLRS